MNVNLNLSRALFNDAFYPLLFDYSHRWEVYMGSAGSGKSYHIGQKLVIRALIEPNIRIMITRKYGTTLRETVFSMMKSILKMFKIREYVKVNESDFRMTFPNGSQIIFSGLDDETKLLSLNDVSCIWVEEAYEVEKDMVEQLDLRMRGNHENMQLILSFNPINTHHWLHAFIDDPPKSFVYHHSTYLDNKFLKPEYIATLEEMKIRNPQKARVFVYGEWGVNPEGLVLPNFSVDSLNSEELAKKYEHRCGMDFGYNDPSAIVETFYDEAEKKIYIVNEFYAKGQTLDELYNAICNMHLNKSKIQCDSAEPRTIEFFRKKMINAVPCIKGPNSINARIQFLQNSTIVVDKGCVNVIMELENFSYEKDRRTGEYTDKTTHEYSHSIDALGYAYSDLYTKSRMRTIPKAVLGV